jgi:hypothetical protein
MAGFRVPNILIAEAKQPNLDDGTSARTPTPAPGPLKAENSRDECGPRGKVDCRYMTAGEVAMSRQVFKDVVNYCTVVVHKHGYFFGRNSKRTAVTPNGQIYFNKEDYQEDFSVSTPRNKRWFMHEMVHVWQYQLGYWVKLAGMFSWAAPYKSVLTPDKRLSDYGMEQQGDIIADYFALKVMQLKDWVENEPYKDNLPLFETVLTDFLADPSSKANLPNGDSNARQPTNDGP